MPVAVVLLALALLLPLAAGDPPAPPTPTAEQIAALTYDDVTEDVGFVTPLAADLERFKDDEESAKRFAEWRGQLDTWAPGKVADQRQRVVNLLGVAVLSDIGQGEFEAEAAYAVFEKLKKDVPRATLVPILAGIVITPDSATYPQPIAELGLEVDMPMEELRARGQIYAKKLLGRLLGKLPPKE